MSKYSFDIALEADSEKEATEKMKAAITLIQKLKTTEIKKLAEVVATDPTKTALAKKYLGL